MKKLLSFFAAGAVLLGSLGLFSCSGDLHDNETQPLYIIGAGDAFNNWSWDNPKQLELVEADGSVQKYTFKAVSSTADFKLATSPDWNHDIAGDDIDKVYPKINGDFVELHSREAEGLPNTQDIIVNDLTAGEEYTINVKFNATSLATSLQVTGAASEMPNLQIVAAADVTKLTDNNDKTTTTVNTYTMTRSGTTYTYEFIAAAKLDNFAYYFTCPATMNSYKLGAKSSTEINDKEAYSLVKVDDAVTDAHGNKLDANGDVTVKSDYDIDYWTDAAKGQLVKDKKYKITVVLDNETLGFDGGLSTRFEAVDMFEDSELVGQWTYADNHDGDYAKSVKSSDNDASYTFTPVASEVAFKIYRKSSDTTMAWVPKNTSKNTIKASSTVGEEGTPISLSYVTTMDNDDIIYVDAEEEKAVEAAYITATGLSTSKQYVIGLHYTDDDGVTVALSVYKPISLTDTLKLCEVKGAYNGWSSATSLDDDGVYDSKTDTFTVSLENISGGSKFEWGIFEKDNSAADAIKYTGASITSTGKKDSVTNKVELEKGADNATISGLNPSSKFDIIITNSDGKVYAQVKVTDEGTVDNRTFAQKVAQDYYIKGAITDDSWSFNAKAASVTYSKTTKDNDTVTAKYGPFESSVVKSTNKEWLLTNDSTFYRRSTLKAGVAAPVKLYVDDNNSKLDGSALTKYYYYIVIKASDDGITAVIEETDTCDYNWLTKPALVAGSNGNFDIGNWELVTGSDRTIEGYAEFTFKTANEAWGGSNSEGGIMEFGLVTDTNWSTKWVDATNLSVDGDYTATKKGGDSNNKVTGLEAGSKYRVYVLSSFTDGIKVKVSRAE